MQEENFNKNRQQEPFDLEQRLTSYYGPPLREQPLSSSSWQKLQQQLGPQEPTGRRNPVRRHLLRKRSQAEVPAFVQDAFARITYEARIPYVPSMLRYQPVLRAHDPIVHSSWLGKRTIKLLMPVNKAITMRQAELDVLLAAGVARSIYARKPTYMVCRLLLTCIALLASIILILSLIYHLSLIMLPITIILYAIVVMLLHIQARSIAFRADTLMVRWLGREHVCNGLHALADRSRAPRRRRWGEPSLVERIRRVCGTRAEARENELTLTR